MKSGEFLKKKEGIYLSDKMPSERVIVKTIFKPFKPFFVKSEPDSGNVWG